MTQAFNDRTPLQRLLWLGGMAKAAGGKGVEETASGNPVVFTTDLARPLSRLALTLLPRQSGTGDPSPSNIRPLLPWGEVGTWLSRGIDTFVQGGIVDGTGANTASSQRIRTDFIPVSVLTELKNTVEIYGTGYAENEPVIRLIHFYNASKQWLGAIRTDLILIPSFDIYQSQIPTGTEYFKVSAQKNSVGTDNISPDGIVLFTNKQSSHPVNLTGITPPVYGASVDLTTGEVWGTTLHKIGKWSEFNSKTTYTDTKRGDLVLDADCLYASLGGNGKTLCDKLPYIYNNLDNPHYYLTDSRRIRAFVPVDTADDEEFEFVCTLATPVLLATLSPQQISALVGVNTVWSDADGIELTYLKKG